MAGQFLPQSMLQTYEQDSGEQLKLNLDDQLRQQADQAAEAANNNPYNLLAQSVPMTAPGPSIKPLDFPGSKLPMLGAQVPVQKQGFVVGMDDPNSLQNFMPDEYKSDPTTEPPSGPANANVGAHSDLIAKYSKQYGVPADVIAGIMDIESGGNTKAQSPAGAMGAMQVMPDNFKEGEDGFDPETNIRVGTQMLADRYRRYGSWDKAAASYFGAMDSQGNITDATDAGGQTGSGYVAKFNDARKKYATTLPDAPETTANGSLFGITPDQFHAGFDAATAYAACGIVAAMAFAKANGRMPTPEEAKDLAVNYGGWSIEQGMGGPAGVVNMLAKMGIAAHQESGIDFDKVKHDLAGGNPVAIDTPQHYYTIEAYDPATGRYKLGNDQDPNTPDWATEDQIRNTRWGAPRATIYADNPASPGLSVANKVNDPSPGPTENPLDWKKRLDSMLSDGRTQLQNAWNGMSQDVANVSGDGVKAAGDVLNSIGAKVKEGNDALIGGLNNASDQLTGALNQGTPGFESAVGQGINALPESGIKTIAKGTGDIINEQAQTQKDFFEAIQKGDTQGAILAIGKQIFQNATAPMQETGVLGSGASQALRDTAFKGIAPLEARPFPNPMDPNNPEQNFGVPEIIGNSMVPVDPVGGLIGEGISKVVGGVIKGAGRGIGAIADKLAPQGAEDIAGQLAARGIKPIEGGAAGSFKDVADRTLENGGATYDPSTGRFWEGDGYAVSGVKDPQTGLQAAARREVFEPDESGRLVNKDGLTPEEVTAQYAKDNEAALAQPGAHIGTWSPPTEPGAPKEVYYDVSEVFDNLSDARKAGLTRGQQAAYRFGDEANPSGDVRLMSEGRSESIQRAIQSGDSADPVWTKAQEEADKVQPLSQNKLPEGSVADKVATDLGQIDHTDAAATKAVVDPNGYYPKMRSVDEYVRTALKGEQYSKWYPEIKDMLEGLFGSKNLDEVARYTWGFTSSRATPETNLLRTGTIQIATRENAAKYQSILDSNMPENNKFAALKRMLSNDYRQISIDEGTLAQRPIIKDGQKVRGPDGKVLMEHGEGIPQAMIEDAVRGMLYGGKATDAVKTPVYGPASTRDVGPTEPMYSVLDTWMHRAFGFVKGQSAASSEGNLLASGPSPKWHDNWEALQGMMRVVADKAGMSMDEAQAAIWVPFRAIWEAGGDWKKRLIAGEPIDRLTDELLQAEPDAISKLGGTANEILQDPYVQKIMPRLLAVKDQPGPGRLGAATLQQKGKYDVAGLVPARAQQAAAAALGMDAEQDENGDWQIRPSQDPARLAVAAALTPQGQKILTQVFPKVAQAIGSQAPAELQNVPKAVNPGDWIKAIRYNSMLTRPATLLINTIGGALETGYKPIRDALTQAPETTVFELLAGAKSLDSALAGAVEAFRHGASDAQVARGDIPKVKLGGPVGLALEAPSRVLGATDEFFQQLVHGMEIGRQASEIARGIDQGSQLAAGGFKATFSRPLTLSERAGLFDVLRASPTQEMTEAALKTAQAATFHGDMGDAGVMFQGAMSKLKYKGVDIGNLFAPFIKTPYNIAAKGIDRTPIGLAGAIFDGAMDAIGNPSVLGKRLGSSAVNAPTKERLVDGAIGTALTVWAFNQAMQGNITGAGPEDPRERAKAERLGAQWNSFKVGDRWYDYNQIGPWAVPLAAAAAAAESALYAKKDDPQDLASRLKDAGGRFAQVWTNNGYLSGISTLADLIQGKPGTAENFTAQTAGSFIPFGGALNTKAQSEDTVMRAPQGVGERIQNRLPNLGFLPTPSRTDLPSKLDVYGRDVPNQQTGFNAVLPIRSKGLSPDPVDEELTRVGANVSLAPKAIGGVDLSRDQQRDYQITSGQNIRAGLEAVMESSDYQSSNDERKKAILANVTEDARARAAALIVAPEDRKITDTGLPPKYNGVTDPKEEIRIDKVIQKVSEFRDRARTMEDPGPEPTEAELEMYDKRHDLTDEYKEEVKRRTLESKNRKSVPLPFDARNR